MRTIRCPEMSDAFVKERNDGQRLSHACKTDDFVGDDHAGIRPSNPTRHAQNTFTKFENSRMLPTVDSNSDTTDVGYKNIGNSMMCSSPRPSSETALDVNGEAVMCGMSLKDENAGDRASATTDNEVRLLTKERDEALERAKYYQQQTDILFQGMNLISRLSSLDSGAYSKTIGCHPTADTDIDASSSKESSSSCATTSSTNSSVPSIQAQLDQLQREWKLEETPIPTLISSVHRLQSNILLLQSQADDFNTNDNVLEQKVVSLQEQLESCTAENKKLKRAAKKLFYGNKHMKEKLNERKAERKSLVMSVKEYVKKKREEDLDKEELFVATKLTVHESMMKIARSNTSNHEKGNNGSGGDSNRQRSWTGGSTSSTFSDFGTYLDRDDSFNHINYDSNHTLDVEGDESNDVNQSPSVRQTYLDCGTSLDDSPASISTSSSSVTSLITDDSSPTVRFSTTSDGDALPPTYVLTLPQNKIGLQFVQVKVPVMPSSDDGENRQTSGFQYLKPRGIAFGSGTSFNNRRRAFSDSGALDLSAVEEGMEGVEGNTKENSLMQIRTKNSRSNTSEKKLSHMPCESKQLAKAHHGFKIDHIFKLNGSSSNDKSIGFNVPDEKQNAFLVKDFQGFDTTLNVRPTIGARLISINDTSLLTGEWTMEKVMAYMKKTEGSESSHDDSTRGSGYVSLTFRNDTLDKKQKTSLNSNTGSDKRPEDSQSNDAGKTSAANPTIASMSSAKKSPKNSAHSHFFPSSFLGMKMTKKESTRENDRSGTSRRIAQKSQNSTGTKKDEKNDPISDALGINFIKFF